MTEKPSYIVHEVQEKDITVDWFFGRGHWRTKVGQAALLAVAWFFAVLPVIVTASALLNADNPDEGWWHFAEGYRLWTLTITFLGIFFVWFVVSYLVLLIINRISNRKRNKVPTFDDERLEKRLTIAQSMYVEKYGPRNWRIEQRRVEIQPYASLEPFELRGHYRSSGVE
jgi:hypothetical protein